MSPVRRLLGFALISLIGGGVGVSVASGQLQQAMPATTRAPVGNHALFRPADVSLLLSIVDVSVSFDCHGPSRSRLFAHGVL